MAQKSFVTLEDVLDTSRRELLKIAGFTCHIVRRNSTKGFEMTPEEKKAKTASALLGWAMLITTGVVCYKLGFKAGQTQPAESN